MNTKTTCPLVLGRFRLMLLAFVLTVLFCMDLQAADTVFDPFLHAGPDGLVVGGYQLSSGSDGEFELVTLEPEKSQVYSLGRYSGRLAGVVSRGSGEYLALTRDGSLGIYGDNPEILALPDSRWNLHGLTIWNGTPVALQQEADSLRLVSPDADRSWRELPGRLPSTKTLRNVLLLPEAGQLRLFWNNRSDDLGEGVLRQAVYRDGGWVLGRPLPLGEASAFGLLSRDGRLSSVALVPDPITPGPAAVKSFRLLDGEWQAVRLPEAVSRLLEKSYSFAVAGFGDEQAVWLATGPDGAHVLWPDSRVTTVRKTARDLSQWPGWGGLITLAALTALVAMYCRRSRLLSRALPGRPADFLSRGAALLADWLIVSVAMVTYHIANGDIHILPVLMLSGDVMELFWVNLAALILFTAASEGLFGKTPGKHLARLRVRSVRGGPPAMIQAILRNLLRVVDMFPAPVAFPGIIGMVATFLGPRRQRIGDMLAGTQVRRHLPLRERRFLLASASPRREELLGALGLPVRTMTPGVDEERVVSEAGVLAPADMVLLLAREKATSVIPAVTEREIVVAADTVVVVDDTILQKPRDRDDAIRMLTALSGRSHKVFTGVAVWDGASGQAVSEYDETEVEFRVLTQAEIEAYVDTGDPMDKAGSYGIQNSRLVREVRGSLSNVMGLPMEKLQKLLWFLDS